MPCPFFKSAKDEQIEIPTHRRLEGRRKRHPYLEVEASVAEQLSSSFVQTLRALRKFLLALLTSCLYPSPICLATTLAPNSTCKHGLGSLTLSWRDRIHGYLGLCLGGFHDCGAARLGRCVCIHMLPQLVRHFLTYLTIVHQPQNSLGRGCE